MMSLVQADKRSKDPTIVIVGGGYFGALVANELARSRWKVIVVDKNVEKLAAIRDEVAHVVLADATDPATCADLSKDAAVVLVSFVEPRETSMLIVACMKMAGALHVVAKAANPAHAEALSLLGADRVIFPERDQAAFFASELARSLD